MKKVFNFGKIDFESKGKAQNLVTVEMEYKTDGDKKRFSVCGNVWNALKSDILCGGQCLDTIAPYMENEPVFNEILRLWTLYHLNDMHPECEHQHAAGWAEKAKEKVNLYHWRINDTASKEKRKAEKMAIEALQKGETFTPSEEQRFFANLEYGITTHTETLPEKIAAYYEPKKSSFGGHIEVKALGWLRETEHPDGILSKTCPVCGYKYGSSWVYFPIPENDEKIIIQLLENGGLKNE